jgi:NADPH:quinone reductase-like Zn-dependent oxidoreductase
MQAVLINDYGDENVLELAEVDQPKREEDQILVRVLTVGVNTADWEIRDGGGERFGLKLPIIPGIGIAGTVAATGLLRSECQGRHIPSLASSVAILASLLPQNSWSR